MSGTLCKIIPMLWLMSELRGLSNLWNFKHADLSKTFFPSRRQFLFNWVPHHHQHIARGMLPHIAMKCKFFFNNSTTTKQASQQSPAIYSNCCLPHFYILGFLTRAPIKNAFLSARREYSVDVKYVFLRKL